MDGTTLGVEEELLIVDRRTGALVARSDELVPVARAALGPRVTAELNRCQIEFATGIHEDLGTLRAELVELRQGVDEAAASLGCAVLTLGTHPWSSWQLQEVEADRDRYRALEDRYQRLARQQVICGCHVHVGLADPDLAVAVMTRVRRWLPVLVALAANSPYWVGEETGYDSYRTEVWARWPTSGMPPELADRAAYDEVVGQLRGAGIVEDPAELYWHLRPSERFPTLELRATDVCLTVDDAVTVAGLARGLVRAALEEVDRGDSAPAATPDLLEAALWQAARYGLGQELVSPRRMTPVPASEALDELLDEVGPHLDDLGDRTLVTRGVAAVLERGNGATRQRGVGPTAAVELARAVLLPAD
jgi:carboxylate-amine ligase